jgi:hypothetical protein
MDTPRSTTKQEIKFEVCISDPRCANEVDVSFWDLKVCKRSLRSFLGFSCS